MINVQITGSLPKVNPKTIEDTMLYAEEIMLASVQMNITIGGRPKFNTKNPNATPLVGSGRMYAGIKSEHDEKSARVYMDDSVVSSNGFFYPKALNDGADIPPVAGKLMVFEIDGHTVFTRKRKGFHLGPFPFFLFQSTDIDNIIAHCGEVVFSINEEIE